MNQENSSYVSSQSHLHNKRSKRSSSCCSSSGSSGRRSSNSSLLTNGRIYTYSPKPAPRKTYPYESNLNNSMTVSKVETMTKQSPPFSTSTMPTPRKPRTSTLTYHKNLNNNNNTTSFLLDDDILSLNSSNLNNHNEIEYDLDKLRVDYSFDKYHIDMNKLFTSSTLTRPKLPPPPLPQQPPPSLFLHYSTQNNRQQTLNETNTTSSSPFNNSKRYSFLMLSKQLQQNINIENDHQALLGFERISLNRNAHLSDFKEEKSQHLLENWVRLFVNIIFTFDL